MKSIKTKIGHLKMKRSKNSKNFLIKKTLIHKTKSIKKIPYLFENQNN